MDKSFANSTIT